MTYTCTVCFRTLTVDEPPPANMCSICTVSEPIWRAKIQQEIHDLIPPTDIRFRLRRDYRDGYLDAILDAANTAGAAP